MITLLNRRNLSRIPSRNFHEFSELSQFQEYYTVIQICVTGMHGKDRISQIRFYRIHIMFAESQQLCEEKPKVCSLVLQRVLLVSSTPNNLRECDVDTLLLLMLYSEYNTLIEHKYSYWILSLCMFSSFQNTEFRIYFGISWNFIVIEYCTCILITNGYQIYVRYIQNNNKPHCKIEYYINLNNPVVVLNLTPLSFVSSLLLLPHWSKIFRFFRSTKSRQNQTFVNSISKCLPTFSLAIIQITVLLYSNYPFYDVSIYTKAIKNCMSTKLKGRFENSRKYL